MPQEIELKFRLDSPADLRARLAELGAVRDADVFEVNQIFDTRNQSLLAADCGLRVRESRPIDDHSKRSTTITYKGPRAADAPKSREEIELDVQDVGQTVLMLERLGFRRVILFEKRRETWRLDDCMVCADELPTLGHFVEIEGPSAERVQILADELGFGEASAVQETYVHMAAEHGQLTGADEKHLRF